MYEEVLGTAKAKEFEGFLKPIKTILEGGNTAQYWLNLYEGGWSIRKIIQQSIKEMEYNERKFRIEIGEQALLNQDIAFPKTSEVQIAFD